MPLCGGALACVSIWHRCCCYCRWAPAALRALYERDLRRCFCPPAMWLAPFEAEQATGAASAASAEERFSAAAVVRALSPPADAGEPGGAPCQRGEH